MRNKRNTYLEKKKKNVFIRFRMELNIFRNALCGIVENRRIIEMRETERKNRVQLDLREKSI